MADRPRPETLRPTAVEELELSAAGYRLVAGIDEAGRGCLAGPVVAAAVVLKPDAYSLQGRIQEVRDSKLLSPSTREELFGEVRRSARGVGVGVVGHDWIDAYGIVHATRVAMVQAAYALPLRPDFLLIDYLTLPEIAISQKGIVYGDAICISIAAASIIAKVHRDRLMAEQDAAYPGYGFAQHKGYGTPAHLSALQRLGPCGIHRRSFAPVKQLDIAEVSDGDAR
ncbi:MAG: ribonuclease HII [Chloroflexi bacterium]|nr:ribonuclease HII [Chloroflexota bacterium]